MPAPVLENAKLTPVTDSVEEMSFRIGSSEHKITVQKTGLESADVVLDGKKKFSLSFKNADELANAIGKQILDPEFGAERGPTDRYPVTARKLYADLYLQSTEPNAKTSARQLHYGPFPAPEALRPQIDFWKKTYTEFGRNQVAFHDKENPKIIWAVMNVPYDEKARIANPDAFIAHRKAEADKIYSVIQDSLNYLATGAAPRNDSEKSFLAIFRENGGKNLSDLTQCAQNLRSQSGLKEDFADGLQHLRQNRQRYEGDLQNHKSQDGNASPMPTELARLPLFESHYDLSALSKSGARGVWQFMPGTARDNGLTVNAKVDERIDPDKSTLAAARYFESLHSRMVNRYGEEDAWPLAILAYNSGATNVDNAVAVAKSTKIEDVSANNPASPIGYAGRNYYSEYIAAIEVERAARSLPQPAASIAQPVSQPKAVAPSTAPSSTSEPRPAVANPPSNPSGIVATKASLKGSSASLELQNAVLSSLHKSKIHDHEVMSALRSGRLEKIRNSPGVEWDLGNHSSSTPYIAPEANTFLKKLGLEFKTFSNTLDLSRLTRIDGEPAKDSFIIKSGFRTVDAQQKLQKSNANASDRSVHPTGYALDISWKRMTDAQAQWLGNHLLDLEKAGKIEVTKEIYQACYHVVVFPKPIRSRQAD